MPGDDDERKPILSVRVRPRPPSGLAAVRVAAATTSVGTLRGRRLAGLLILVGFPALVVLAVMVIGNERGTGMATFVNFITRWYLAWCLPLLAIFLGTAALGDEWEAGTSPYAVGVPLPRWAIICGRWLACVRRALMLLLPAVVVLYLLSLMSFEGAIAQYVDDLLWILAGLSLLVVGYTATFLFFGLALKHSILGSFAFLFLFDGLLANLPLGLAFLSIPFHARNLIWQMTGDDRFHGWTFDIVNSEPVGAGWSVVWILGWTALFLLISTYVLSRKESTGAPVTEGASEGN